LGEGSWAAVVTASRSTATNAKKNTVGYSLVQLSKTRRRNRQNAAVLLSFSRLSVRKCFRDRVKMTTLGS